MISMIKYNGREMTTATWFHDELADTFLNINTFFEHNQNQDHKLFLAYWEAFVRHSLSFFEFCLDRNCTTPVAMSVRLFLEYASDLNFLYLHPENIPIVKAFFDKCQPTNTSTKEADPFLMARKLAEIPLYKYKNGQRKNKVSTSVRVSIAFPDGGSKIYDYLNCYSHVNCVGALWNAINDYLEENFWKQQRLSMVRLYPDTLSVFVHSLGKLCGIRYLEEYDFSSFEQKFQDIEYI